MERALTRNLTEEKVPWKYGTKGSAINADWKYSNSAATTTTTLKRDTAHEFMHAAAPATELNEDRGDSVIA